MKKILLATTVLAVSAGYAAADIKTSGTAFMAVNQTDVGGVNGSTTGFQSRVRIQFDASGTTDGGLSFGATVRADQDAGNGETIAGIQNGTTLNGNTNVTPVFLNSFRNESSTVFVSGAFGKITFGDVSGGAGDELVGQTSDVGIAFNNNYSEIGFTGDDLTAAPGTAVRYDYTAGAFSFAIGLGQRDQANGDYGIEPVGTYANKESVAVKYGTDMYSVAVSYTTGKDDATNQKATDVSGLAMVKFGGATVKIKARNLQGDGIQSKTDYSGSLDYAISKALSMTVVYTDHAFADYRTTGFGVSYDLGGGASAVLGYESNNGNGVATATTTGIIKNQLQAGVSMSF